MKFFLLFIFMLFSLCPALSAEETVSIDFDAVDIRTMIRFMSELSGENYIVDNAVSGRVSVVSSSQIPLSQAFEVLEAALAVNNFVVVSSPEGVHRIVPRESARLGSSASKSRSRMLTRVFSLKYARAEKLREIVLPLLSPAGVVSVHAGTNSLIISESAGALEEIEKLIAELDRVEQGPDKAKTNIVTLQNTVPSEVAAIAQQVYDADTKSYSSAASADKAKISFVPDDAAGTLVFSAPAQQEASIRAMIEKLDARAAQVFVEALIVEMSDSQTLAWGLELAAAGGAVFGTASGFADTATVGVTKRILTGGEQTATSVGFVDSTTTRGGTTVPDIGALITASQGNDDIRILSSPRLIASNNEEARILVGQTVPFIRNSQVTAEGGTVRTFEFKDVGLLLKIVPNILSREQVRLKVHQEVESVVGQSFEGAVETSKRMLSTMVTVVSGQTIVLGGLKSDRVSNQVVRVPLLGHIPLLGKIFTSERKSVETMNLFLLMTPSIVSSSTDIDALREKQIKDSTSLASVVNEDGTAVADTEPDKGK